MSRCEKSVGSGVYRRSAWRGLVLLSTAVVLVSACGSDDKGSSSEMTVAVAGAQENVVASGGVCYSWPNGRTDAQPCAVGLKGPGGGRVFYDAGSVQSWGRFLEVAPQRWKGTLVSCPGLFGSSCGTADPDIIPRSTSDGGPDLVGYYICLDSPVVLPSEAGAMGGAIGDGRRNTEVLSQTPECADGSNSAVSVAAGYRGGGLADWYLPSVDELVALCRYPGRDAIGGFPADGYLSSSGFIDSDYSYDYTNFFEVDFGDGDCFQTKNIKTNFGGNVGVKPLNVQRYIRPIRAFA